MVAVSSAAMSNRRVVCGPVEGFVAVYVLYNIMTMTTSLYFDNLKFDVCDMQCVSVPLCHACIAYWQISMCPLRCKLIVSTPFVPFTLN